ncbi:DNA polymerase II [compost metagenome]
MLEELSVHGYAWNESDDPVEGHCVVQAWCLNKQSEPSLLLIKDYPVFCHIELPRVVNGREKNWKTDDVLKVRKFIMDRLKLGEEDDLKLNFINRQRLYYYRGTQKYPMLLAQFKTIEAMKHCHHIMNERPISIKELGMNMICRVHETDIPVARKMLTMRGCEYSSWFTIHATPVPESEKISSLQREYVVDWKTMSPLDVQWGTTPKIMAIDIETYSDRHKCFPDKFNAKHVAFMVSVVVQRYKQPETRMSYQIMLGFIPKFRNTKCINVQSEADLCDKLSELVRLHDPEVITGYNIFGFDIPYLTQRLNRRMRDWAPMGRIKGSLITPVKEKVWESSAYGRQELYFLLAEGRICVDMLVNIKRDHKLSNYKLDTVAKKFLKRGKLDVSAEQMFIGYERIMNKLNSKVQPEDIESMNATLVPSVQEDSFDPSKMDQNVRDVSKEHPVGYQEFDSKFDKIAESIKHDFRKKLYYDVNDTWQDFLMRNCQTQVDANGSLSVSIDDIEVLDIEEMKVLGIPKHVIDILIEFKKIAEYCDEDSVLVLDIIDITNTWDGLIQMSNVAGVPIFTIFTSGQQIRCYNLLYSASFKRSIVLDKRNTPVGKFKGGLVREPIPGKHKYVICLDYNSLYPSIIRAYNICFTTLVPPECHSTIKDEDCHTFEWEEEDDEASGFVDEGSNNALDAEFDDDVSMKRQPKMIKHCYKFMKYPKGILPQLCEDLTNNRNEVRKKILKPLQDENGDPRKDLTEFEKVVYIIAHERQLAIKVTNNSVYGFLGATNGLASLPEAARCITFIGRMLITQANTYLETTYVGSIIVYNDTDSTMVKLPFVDSYEQCMEWGLRLEHELSALFPDPLYMEFEKAGDMFCIKKKKYSYWLIDSKTMKLKVDASGNPVLMNKGILLARRDNCAYQRECYAKILQMIMLDSDIHDTIYEIQTMIARLYSGAIPYHDLTVVRSIGAVYKNPNYFMKVFADELQRLGIPAKAGDRLEYLIVKDSRGSTSVGMKMRTPEIYLQRCGTPEEEQIDFDYYSNNGLLKCLQQLVTIAYKPDISYLLNEYQNRDIIRFLHGAVALGLHEEVQYVTSTFRTYPEAYQWMIDNPRKGFKGKLNKLRIRFITRYKQINGRVTDTPVKNIIKMHAIKTDLIKEVKKHNIHLKPYNPIEMSYTCI